MKKWLLFCLSVLLFSCSESELETLNDGPYVLYGDRAWQALWVCNGQPKRFEFPPPLARKRIEKCNLSAQLNNQTASRPELAFDNVETVAALSDIHGQFDVFRSLLMAHKIADEQGNWTFGKGHLVVSGDVFSRGPKVTESLWYLANLERQAKSNGGVVHYLLGNHEIMALNNDTRYMHDKYATTEKVLGKPLSELIGPKTVLGDWLLTRNVLVKINRMLFVHGGIHPSLATQNLSLQDINQTFVSHMIKDDTFPESGLGHFLHKTYGPIWYRGYFKAPRATMGDVDRLLQHYDLSHLIVGHTTQTQITPFYNGKVIAVDSGIKRGETGEILLIKNGNFFRGLRNGAVIPFE
ncbi:metallophosphoesterase [Alteromonas sediminis]|uniref:Metallophosphoesterase n=1 Tax=Alteromonas sediminis TaxID=2259342 RepID=A0A3N5YAQ6_9ALTE|nr:metallophosphoesterase [Alteromonas sediminis]RPJ65915.1 metallophosphoesterase [Alteromonas sediminis]